MSEDRKAITETMRAEMMMHAFRMMRSDRYRTAAALLRAMKEDFPQATEADIKEILGRMARKALEQME